MEELALFYVSNLFLFLLVNSVNPGSGSQSFYHEQSLQEMLRKARQQQQQQKGKATQHNSPETVIFKEKLAASGGTRTHDRQLSR